MLFLRKNIELELFIKQALISRNFCDKLSTVWKSTIKRDHAQKFPGNQLFSKNIDLTEKMVIVFLTTFQHSVFSKNVDFCENSVKSIHLRMS